MLDLFLRLIEQTKIKKNQKKVMITKYILLNNE